MNEVTSLILRRMRTPLILIVTVYSIAIIGLTLIPGVDDNGNVWHMSIFHAFYFVSYTATTIGFGEIPYTLSEAQRLWSIVIIYATVITWFYSLGKLISLFQDTTFRAAVHRHTYKRDIKKISRPYYVVCGFGETGKAVVHALLEEEYDVVVIDQQNDVLEMSMHDFMIFVPHISADATNPEILEISGVHTDKCRGVIAVTASDEVNLKIAISSKLLHPDVTVVCRSEHKEYEENMLSFGTNHIVNPFECFAHIFSMALHSPATHLIYEWLTGSPDISLSLPVKIQQGHWILSGYGRLGKSLHRELHSQDINTVVIDPNEASKAKFMKSHHSNDQFLIGTGTDAKTLTSAGIQQAAGIIAGTPNDSDNLSIIMTARQLNKDVFVIGRQNYMSNKMLYAKINEYYQPKSRHTTKEINETSHLVLQPSEVIARKIRAVLLSPLLLEFINLASHQDHEWALVTISRITAVVGENPPSIWTIKINKERTPAVAQALGYGRRMELGHIIKNPVNYQKNLACVPLLIKRGETHMLLPESDAELKAFDQILFCGHLKEKHSMQITLHDFTTLNYVMTSKDEPQSFLWKAIMRYTNKAERRIAPR